MPSFNSISTDAVWLRHAGNHRSIPIARTVRGTDIGRLNLSPNTEPDGRVSRIARMFDDDLAQLDAGCWSTAPFIGGAAASHYDGGDGGGPARENGLP